MRGVVDGYSQFAQSAFVRVGPVACSRGHRQAWLPGLLGEALFSCGHGHGQVACGAAQPPWTSFSLPWSSRRIERMTVKGWGGRGGTGSRKTCQAIEELGCVVCCGPGLEVAEGYRAVEIISPCDPSKSAVAKVDILELDG